MSDPMPWEKFTDPDDDDPEREPEHRTFEAALWDKAGPNPERGR